MSRVIYYTGLIKEVSLERVIDNLIQEAIARGEFHNLDGQGKPLDLTAYFNTPEDLRMAYSVLKSNQIVPQEVELIRQIVDLRQKIGETEDEAERTTLTRELNERILALDLAIEKYKRRR
jgi:hypothetical protein